MPNSPRILLLEADADMAEEVVNALGKAVPVPVVEVVDRGDDIRCRAKEFAPDLIVADPGFEIPESESVPEFARVACPGVPVILISDLEGEAPAVEALRSGAIDYVFKGRLSRLAKAVEGALRTAADGKKSESVNEIARTSEARHRYFLEQTMEGFYRLDFEPPIPIDLDEDTLIARMYESGSVVECNRVFAQTYGYATPESMCGVRLVDIHGGSDIAENVEALREFVRAGFRHLGVETVEVGADGEPVYLLNNSVGIIENGYYVCCWGTQRDITDQRRAEDLLRQSHGELRALASNLRRLQDEERSHCSRVIHDELGQLLTGLKMDIRWLEERLSKPDVPPQLNPILDRAVAASELVDETISAVQRIAANMRPGALDQLSLSEVLTAAARRFEERYEIPVSVYMMEPQPDISSGIANELFYICQEALTNVARHASAKAVEIRLRKDGGALVLEVSDDGVGIDVAGAGIRQSLGVLGMVERALQYGGTVEVGGGDAGGTRVCARIPLGEVNSNREAKDAGTPC